MFCQIPLTKIEVGMQASCSKIITDRDTKLFAEISGDKNPLHLDEEFAKNSRYKKRIAHGMHYASFFSSIFGTQIPGSGCVIFEQNFKFKLPVYIGEKVLANVRVTQVDIAKKKIFFETICKVNTRIVMKGNVGISVL